MAKEIPEWGALHKEMQAHMAAHEVDPTAGEVNLSGMLDFDVAKGAFTGSKADQANAFLKRQYRAPYVVPELA